MLQYNTPSPSWWPFWATQNLQLAAAATPLGLQGTGETETKLTRVKAARAHASGMKGRILVRSRLCQLLRWLAMQTTPASPQSRGRRYSRSPKAAPAQRREVHP